MLILIWIIGSTIYAILHPWMPSSILVNAIRNRRAGLKWGIPAMLLALPYFWAAALLIGIIENGGPEWLYFFVLVACWSGLKMLWLGPVSLILLARARTREYAQRRADRKVARTRQSEDGRVTAMAGGRA